MVSSFEEVPARDRVIVALDCGIEEAFDLADQLQGKATWMKVGMTLFYANGPAIVYALKERGFKVFLDLKFHDIPHQVEGAAYAAAGSGADMLTMHTVGGVDMMAAAQKGAERAASEYGHDAPATLGITVLTSMNDAALAETGVSRAMADQVVVLAEQAKRAEVRDDLKSGKLTLEKVLEMKNDPVVGRMKVSTLIETLPGYGKAKAEKIMKELQIAESRRLRGLGERQQTALLERLG